MRTCCTALVAVVTTGCFSTSHVPRDPRKVYMTMQDSVRGYTRGGEFYSELGFGGGLIDAVESNPRALDQAETFRDRMIFGLIGMLGGSLCIPTALVYGAVDGESSEGGDGFTDAAGYVAIGCTVLMFAGAFSLASAQAYQLDAINIFNDDVDAQWVAPTFPPPAQLPYATPPTPAPTPAPMPAPVPMGPGGQ